MNDPFSDEEYADFYCGLMLHGLAVDQRHVTGSFVSTFTVSDEAFVRAVMLLFLQDDDVDSVTVQEFMNRAQRDIVDARKDKRKVAVMDARLSA